MFITIFLIEMCIYYVNCSKIAVAICSKLHFRVGPVVVYGT